MQVKSALLIDIFLGNIIFDDLAELFIAPGIQMTCARKIFRREASIIQVIEIFDPVSGYSIPSSLPKIFSGNTLLVQT